MSLRRDPSHTGNDTFGFRYYFVMGEPPTQQPPALDPDPLLTFAAVGRAISEWEMLETYLAILYSIFVGQPRSIDIMEQFGREGRIFVERMRILEEAAASFFRRAPNQAHEGRLSEIIAIAHSLSTRRHQIAHGVVQPMPTYSATNTDADGWVFPEARYGVFPPMYAVHRLTHIDGVYYMYGSAEICTLATRFAECAVKARDFGMLLAGPD